MPRSILVQNAREVLQTRAMPDAPLRGDEMQHLHSTAKASVLVTDGNVEAIIAAHDKPSGVDEVIDATGRYVIPGWCDSHTHIVFAKSREEEFVDRINGLTYEEIAERGGGILNSARKLAQTSEDDLFTSAMGRLNEVIKFGTGAIEIKSGYGLSIESELKMLRVIKRIKEVAPIPVKATFLGAHAFPLEYRQDHRAYLDLLIRDLLPAIAKEGLADYIDVFCERGFFSLEESEEIITAGAGYGLRPKIHVNQLSNSGGVQLGIAQNALSVDHLENIGPEEIEALSQSDTIATLLPSCSFFIDLPFAPARALIDSGAAVALATDYNPGSTPSGRVPFLLSLACIKMRLTPAEAINAATINGAFAMEIESESGVITPGRPARFMITRPMQSLAYIPYAFGSDHVEKMVLGNEIRHFA